MRRLLSKWQRADQRHQRHSAGHRHQVVFGRAPAAAHHEAVFAVRGLVVRRGSSEAGVGDRRLGLVQYADGAVLADAVRDFVRVHPERELPRQKREKLCGGESDAAGRLANQRVHFVIDANAAVTGTFLRPVGEPVMLVVFCRKKNDLVKIMNST